MMGVQGPESGGVVDMCVPSCFLGHPLLTTRKSCHSLGSSSLALHTGVATAFQICPDCQELLRILRPSSWLSRGMRGQ